MVSSSLALPGVAPGEVTVLEGQTLELGLQEGSEEAGIVQLAQISTLTQECGQNCDAPAPGGGPA